MKEGESCQFLKGRMPDYLVMGVGACRADGQVTTMSNKYRAIALMPNSLILPLGHRQVEIKLIMEWYRLILTADHVSRYLRLLYICFAHIVFYYF